MPLHVRMGGALVTSRLSGVARRGGTPRPFVGEEVPIVPASDAVGGLSTDFTSPTWDWNDWPWSYGSPIVDTDAGTLTLPAVGTYVGIDAGGAFDFRGKRAVVRGVSFPSRGVGYGGLGSIEAMLMVYNPDTGDMLGVRLSQGALHAVINDSAVISIDFNASRMRWWQVREADGTVYMEYSSNGRHWHTLHTVETPEWMEGSANVQLHCGHWDEPGDPPGEAWVVDAYGYVPAERAEFGLVTPGGTSPADYASTPDSSPLDIVGDIDIRVELTTDWESSATDNCALVAKFEGTNNRGFLLRKSPAGNDQLQFIWSTNGTASGQSVVSSSAAVPFSDGQRGAVRVTLDVDNGSGGRTVRFYTGPSVYGPWEQLGSDQTAAGTTSIANVSAPLAVGAWSDGSAPIAATFHALRVYDSSGALVVDAPFQRAWKGVPVYTDRTGNVWTFHGSAEIV